MKLTPQFRINRQRPDHSFWQLYHSHKAFLSDNAVETHIIDPLDEDQIQQEIENDLRAAKGPAQPRSDAATWHMTITGGRGGVRRPTMRPTPRDRSDAASIAAVVATNARSPRRARHDTTSRCRRKLRLPSGLRQAGAFAGATGPAAPQPLARLIGSRGSVSGLS